MVEQARYPVILLVKDCVQLHSALHEHVESAPGYDETLFASDHNGVEGIHMYNAFVNTCVEKVSIDPSCGCRFLPFYHFVSTYGFVLVKFHFSLMPLLNDTSTLLGKPDSWLKTETLQSFSWF